MARKQAPLRKWSVRFFVEVDASLTKDDVEFLVASIVDDRTGPGKDRVLDSYEYEASEA